MEDNQLIYNIVLIIMVGIVCVALQSAWPILGLLFAG